MAISRKSCKGRRPDGKRCRKWKDLNSEGLCPTCSNGEGDTNIQEDRCGMCPSSPSISAAVNDSTTKTSIMIQCNWCDEWFHDQCIGSSSFQSYIGQEPPPDEGNHNNGSKALHLWFCAGCASQQKSILEDIMSSLKNKSGVGEVAGRRLVDGETAHTSSPAPLTVPSNGTSDLLPDSNQESSGVDHIPTASALGSSSRQPTVVPSSSKTNLRVQICFHYRHGKCRHGRNGKKMFNGTACSYLHPQKCVEFCKFGWDTASGGCDGSCGKFHPKLCPSSLNFGRCESMHCTLEHLFGTVRYAKNPYEKLNVHPRYGRNAFDNGFKQTRNTGFYPSRGLLPKTNFNYSQSDFPPLDSKYKFNENCDAYGNNFTLYNSHLPKQLLENKSSWSKNQSFLQNAYEEQYKPSSAQGFSHFSMCSAHTVPKDDHASVSKIAELSNSILQVQKCLDYLMSVVPRSDAHLSVPVTMQNNTRQQFPQNQVPHNEAKNL